MRISISRNKKYRNWILLLSILGFAVTLYLVFNELKTPGYCPKYPVFDLPACFMVISFFVVVFAALFLNNQQIAKILFYTGNIAGIFTGSWFSINHLLGYVQCPVVLKVPLCFAAVITFVVMFFLGLQIETFKSGWLSKKK